MGNSLWKEHVNEGKIKGTIEVTGRRERRHKQLLGDLKEKRIYWNMEEKALDSPLWGTRFGRGYELVPKQHTI